MKPAAVRPHVHHWIVDAANYGRCNRCPEERQFHPETTAWEYQAAARQPDPDYERPASRRRRA